MKNVGNKIVLTVRYLLADASNWSNLLNKKVYRCKKRTTTNTIIVLFLEMSSKTEAALFKQIKSQKPELPSGITGFYNYQQGR